MVQIFRPPNPDPTDERFAFRYGEHGTVEINDGGAIMHETAVPEGWVEMAPGQVPWVPLDRPVGNPGTHRSHCCAKHGCKYSSSACPVKSGELVQEYPCEQCDYEAEYGEDDEEGPHI